MKAAPPPLIEYRHPRRANRRFWTALALTMASGIVVGILMYRGVGGVALFYLYPFVCTVVMGWLAWGKQVVIALAAACTFTATIISIDVFMGKQYDPAFVFGEVFPAWLGYSLVPCLLAAIAVPLTTVQLRARKR